MGYFRRAQARILDGLFHGDIVEGGGIPHETAQAAVDEAIDIQPDVAMNLAAESHFRVGVGKANARPPGPQRVDHFLLVIADAGDDAQTGDHDTTHDYCPQAPPR